MSGAQGRCRDESRHGTPGGVRYVAALLGATRIDGSVELRDLAMERR
jgi:hypothetical protein